MGLIHGLAARWIWLLGEIPAQRRALRCLPPLAEGASSPVARMPGL